MSVFRQFITNATLNVAMHVTLVMASMVSVPIILMRLGREQFAIWVLVITVANVATLLDFGLGAAAVRAIAARIGRGESGAAMRMWQTYLLLLIPLLALVGGGIYFLVPKLLPMLPQETLFRVLLALLAVFTFASSAGSILPQSLNRFDWYNIRGLLVGTATTIGAAGVSVIRPDLHVMIAGVVIAHFATLTVYLWLMVKTWGWEGMRAHWRSSEIRELMRFAGAKFIEIFSAQAVHYFPRFIIAARLPLTVLPLYTIPQSILANLTAVVNQVVLALFPTSTIMLTQQARHAVRKILSIGQALVGLGTVGLLIIFSLWGVPLMTWWLNDQQIATEIHPLLIGLTLAYGLQALSAIPATILEAMNRPQIPALFAMIDALLQIPFILYLLKYGVLGVMWGVILHTAIQVPVFLFVSQRRIAGKERQTYTT